MQDAWIALITVAGSLLTGVLVAWSTFRVARAERLEQRRRDIDTAMATFQTSLVKVVRFLSQMPVIDASHPSVRFSNAIARWKEFVSPGLPWVQTQGRLRRTLGEQPFLVGERVVDAASRLQMLDPGPEISEAMEACLDYVMKLGNDRSEETLAKWPNLHKQLRGAIRATRARYGITPSVLDPAPSPPSQSEGD